MPKRVVNVNIDVGLLERIDADAKRCEWSRATWFQIAAEDRLAEIERCEAALAAHPDLIARIEESRSHPERWVRRRRPVT